MHSLRVFAAMFRLNLQVTLAYRTDALINLLVSTLYLGWELLTLSIIFSNTDSLGGWGPADLVALLGVFRLVNALMMAVVWPATERFNQSIRDGSLDYTLLMPFDSQFLVSFQRVVVWSAGDILMGVILIGTGMYLNAASLSTAGILNFLGLAISGVLVIYSLWIVLIALTFWFIKFDNNVTILQALLDAGRYPATIYPAWLRVLVTFVIPIALATTVPLQALRGEITGWTVLGFLAVGMAAALVARLVWMAGVRRYSGASS